MAEVASDSEFIRYFGTTPLALLILKSDYELIAWNYKKINWEFLARRAHLRFYDILTTVCQLAEKAAPVDVLAAQEVIK